MNEIQTLIQHLDSEKAACLAHANALAEDSRKDEADLAKVRANIFGIVLSVCRVAENQPPANALAFVQGKIEAIPQAWHASLAAAQQHNDHIKAAVEQMKLATMAEISGVLAGLLENKQ